MKLTLKTVSDIRDAFDFKSMMEAENLFKDFKDYTFTVALNKQGVFLYVSMKNKGGELPLGFIGDYEILETA